jgi:ADP-ribose pyrophosphatase YjhB (NUDIX family)
VGGFRVRATGVLVEDGKVLLVRQQTGKREWSLPGGEIQPGETLANAVRRELREETGVEVEIDGLLFVAEVPDASAPLLHITMRVRKCGGALRVTANADRNPITDVRLVAVDELTALGFSETFASLVRSDFPNAGAYVGPKSAIGL